MSKRNTNANKISNTNSSSNSKRSRSMTLKTKTTSQDLMSQMINRRFLTHIGQRTNSQRDSYRVQPLVYPISLDRTNQKRGNKKITTWPMKMTINILQMLLKIKLMEIVMKKLEPPKEIVYESTLKLKDKAIPNIVAQTNNKSSN